MTAIWTMNNLLPTGDDLYKQALGSLYGDPAWKNDGVHSGRRLYRKDTWGLSKLDVLSKAQAKDFAWFDELADKLTRDPNNLPPSLRHRVLKDKGDPSKGRRSIDDNAEFKRLVTLHVRSKIGAEIEQVLHPGQLGGRASEFFRAAHRNKQNPTAQDRVARGIFQAVSAGYNHAVLLDLKDAFGNLPREVVIYQLRGLGLSKKAARWVWRLVRIDAVDTQGNLIKKTGRGIEQGNPLSTAIMNLGLAPVLHELDQLNVQAFAYLDDIYIMAPSHQAAKHAFRRFKKTAEKMHFVGIRPLIEGEVEPGSKATRIIDTASATLPVLKTYEIDSLGISLTDEKARDAVEQAREAKAGFTRFPGAGKLGRISRCLALTTAAVRARNSKYLHHPRPFQGPRDGVDEASLDVSPNPTALGEDRTVLPSAPSGTASSTRRGKSHRYPAFGQRCAGLEAPTSFQMNSQSEPAARPFDTYLAYALPGCEREGVCQGLGSGRMGSRACAPYGASTPSGAGVIPYGKADAVLTENWISSRSKWNESILDLRIKDSSRSNRPPYGRTGNSAGSQGRSSRVLPVAFSPEVLAAVQGGKAIKMGNEWKGVTLDFVGFASLVERLPEGTIRLVVNGILRAARVDRKVTVIFDPKEARVWGAMPMGQSTLPVYKQDGEVENLPNGHRRVELVATRRRRDIEPECPEGADVIFLRARRPNRATMKCLVSYLDSDGRKRSLSFVATSPAGPTAALEALVVLAHTLPGTVIAVPRRGAFATVLHERPANPHRALAIHRIRSELSIEERPDHLLVHRSTRFRQTFRT